MTVWYNNEDNLLKIAWFSAFPNEKMDLTGLVWQPYKTKNSFAGRLWHYIGEL